MNPSPHVPDTPAGLADDHSGFEFACAWLSVRDGHHLTVASGREPLTTADGRQVCVRSAELLLPELAPLLEVDWLWTVVGDISTLREAAWDMAAWQAEDQWLQNHLENGWDNLADDLDGDGMVQVEDPGLLPVSTRHPTVLAAGSDPTAVWLPYDVDVHAVVTDGLPTHVEAAGHGQLLSARQWWRLRQAMQQHGGSYQVQPGWSTGRLCALVPAWVQRFAGSSVTVEFDVEGHLGHIIEDALAASMPDVDRVGCLDCLEVPTGTVQPAVWEVDRGGTARWVCRSHLQTGDVVVGDAV